MSAVGKWLDASMANTMTEDESLSFTALAVHVKNINKQVASLGGLNLERKDWNVIERESLHAELDRVFDGVCETFKITSASFSADKSNRLLSSILNASGV